jgi:hypothetical protein
LCCNFPTLFRICSNNFTVFRHFSATVATISPFSVPFPHL